MALKNLALILSLMVIFVASEAPRHRDIQVSVSKQQLQFQANYQDADYQDSFQFKMNLGKMDEQVVRGYFQYQSQKPNQTQLQFDFAIASLMEINTTTSSYFRGDNTTIVSRWPKGGKGVEFLDWVDVSALINGTKVYRYAATTTDGVFTIRVSISSVDVRFAGVPIGPNDVKVDLILQKFPYTHNATTIALQTHLNSITESQNTPSAAILSNNLIFSGRPGFPFGSFSWDRRANATTEEIDMVAWSPQTRADTHFDLFFTFVTSKKIPQPAILIWDPRIGLDYTKGEEFCIGRVCGVGAYFVIIAIVVAGLLLVGLVVMAMVSRRRGYESLHDSPQSTYVS